MISSAKHYLDFETKEPEIDAMVGAIDMSGALDNVGVDDEIEEGLPKDYWAKKIPGGTDESVSEGIGTIALGIAGGLLLLKALGFAAKKVVGAIGRNVTLPKEKLLEVVQTMVKNVIAQSSGKKIDMLQLVALQSFLKDEINAGKITTVKQIIQVIEKLTKNSNKPVDESYEALVKKIKGQGKSEKAAKAIAGAVASYKAKGGGKGPTAKQKARG
jgi:hypothetical protein